MLTPAALSRRSLMKTGVLGGLMLVGASTVAQLQGCANLSPSPAGNTAAQWKLLRPQDRAILGAVAPIALADAFPAERAAALDTFLPQVDAFLHSTSKANHEALHQLFDLLNLRIARLALTGIWSSWENMDDEQVESFLTGWRDSSIGQLRLGYAQLTQVLNLVWYAQPANVKTSIYPGAPRKIPTPLTNTVASLHACPDQGTPSV